MKPLGLLCLLLGASLAAAAQAAELGRLFYTPMQRAEMDRKRLAAPAETQKSTARLTINGRIIRSDGKTITWINGVPEEGPRARQGKVGQSIDAGSGETQDGAQRGLLVIEPTR